MKCLHRKQGIGFFQTEVKATKACFLTNRIGSAISRGAAEATEKDVTTKQGRPQNYTTRDARKIQELSNDRLSQTMADLWMANSVKKKN